MEKIVHDFKEVPSDPEKEFVEIAINDISAMGTDDAYERIINDPEALAEVQKEGAKVRIQKDRNGKTKKIEIRDRNGDLLFFKDLGAFNKIDKSMYD